MARGAKRAKTDGGGPQRMGNLRSAASVRGIRFAALSKVIMDIGPGQPESAKRDVVSINVDTKHMIFDFCTLMGSVLFIDFFHPGPQTLIKLQGLVATLEDVMKETKDAANRAQVSKAKKILKNYVKLYENLYYFEATLEEKVISINSFFLDFGDKMAVDVSGLIACAPKGSFR